VSFVPSWLIAFEVVWFIENSSSKHSPRSHYATQSSRRKQTPTN
jgi:hypothetical protein